MRVERTAPVRWFDLACAARLLAASLAIAAAIAWQALNVHAQSGDDGGGYGLIDDRPPKERTAAHAEDALREQQNIDLQERLGKVLIEEDAQGMRVFIDQDKGTRALTPDEYVHLVRLAQIDQQRLGFLYVLFNITTAWGVLWVSVGFLGQALFTFRMVVQWLASEKHKRSVVPVGFWWGSLFGGMMLLAYFIWRKDIVGIVGQSTGAFVYARNLVLIYGKPAVEPRIDVHEDPAPEPLL